MKVSTYIGLGTIMVQQPVFPIYEYNTTKQNGLVPITIHLSYKTETVSV